jgi:hypothetical protein
MDQQKHIPETKLLQLLGDDLHFLNWEKWFAWYPVKLQSGKTAFMRTVYRRKQTIKYRRFPLASIGCFDNTLKLSDIIYSSSTDVVIETLQGTDSYADRVLAIMDSRNPGTYKLE